MRYTGSQWPSYRLRWRDSRLPARGQPLLELGEPYLEADEVLGEFAGHAQLYQFLYARAVPLSLGLRYLLHAFGGYGVEIVHGSPIAKPVDSRWGAPLAPVGTQLPYLAVHLVESFAYPGLQPRLAVVGEVARETPRLFEEHAHILQLRQLGLSHLPSGAPFYSPAHTSILLCFERFPNLAFRPSAKCARDECSGHRPAVD